MRPLPPGLDPWPSPPDTTPAALHPRQASGLYPRRTRWNLAGACLAPQLAPTVCPPGAAPGGKCGACALLASLRRTRTGASGALAAAQGPASGLGAQVEGCLTGGPQEAGCGRRGGRREEGKWEDPLSDTAQPTRLASRSVILLGVLEAKVSFLLLALAGGIPNLLPEREASSQLGQRSEPQESYKNPLVYVERQPVTANPRVQTGCSASRSPALQRPEGSPSLLPPCPRHAEHLGFAQDLNRPATCSSLCSQ